MRFRPHELFPCILVMAIVIVALQATSYAQYTVGVSNTGGAVQTSPATFGVVASITSGTPTITKLVFYRNDVPFKTVSNPSMPHTLDQEDLGQDTYSYRVRAFTSATVWKESSDITVTVDTPRVIVMGKWGTTRGPDRYQDHTADVEAAVAYLGGLGGGTLFFPCIPPASTTQWPGDPQSIYNIKRTITIPDNVTLQGERAEERTGRCRVYWRDVDWNQDTGTDDPPGSHCYNNVDPQNPTEPRGNLLDKPMFLIGSGSSRARVRDLWLYSRSSGVSCDHPRPDIERIAGENTVAIAIYGGDGDIRDIVIENVSISSFTYGIQATTRVCPDPTSERCEKTDHEITDVRLRGVRPATNHRQLYIDARYAYDWDVQNFNISGMEEGQAGVHIVETGRPESPVGEYTGLRFLQLNCNGNPPDRTAAFCTRIEKHGGLYFKQTHHEGVKNAFIVEDIGFLSNLDPLVLEGGVATGEFKDDSMQLYMIGNAAIAAPLPPLTTDPDKGRLEFIGDGVYSTVVDCGDLYWDRTDVNGNPPDWGGWQMQFTHSERNRASFLGELGSAQFQKEHKPCPYEKDGYENIDKIGGEFFNTGVLPTEVWYDADPGSGVDMQPAYSWVYKNTPTCPLSHPCDIAADLQSLMNEQIGSNTFARRGAVYINGSFKISTTVTIPSGMQIIGAPDSVLEYTGSTGAMFQIHAPVGTDVLVRTANIALRNLTMTADDHVGTTGISIIGHVLYDDPPNDDEIIAVGGLSDTHFSGLTFQGFDTGIAADQTDKNPMLDGVSLKHMRFVNNGVAFKGLSDNASNWNVQNLVMKSDSAGAIGWEQSVGGHSLQGVTCEGTSTYPMDDCLSLTASHSFVNGLKPPVHVTNAVTIEHAPYLYEGDIYESRMFSTLLIRNSSLESSDEDPARMNILGKAFITSMNNVYENFYVEPNDPVNNNPGYEGDLTRVTYCGDTFGNAGVYPGLDDQHPNNWVGVPTPTRVKCSHRPYAWDDMVRLKETAQYNSNPALTDTPMAGEFYDDVADDYVLYRPGLTTNAQSYFYIRQAGGTGLTTTVAWGLNGDKPAVGNVLNSNLRSQVVIWRPSTGDWWAKDPFSSSTGGWNFGVNGDIPFVGNFADESGDKDELAVFRPSDDKVYILNQRTSDVYIWQWTEYSDRFHTADFLGKGYDQIAQYDATNEIWRILDPDDGGTYSVSTSWAQGGDVPIVGKFLPGTCAQVGFWRPGSVGEFILQDTMFGSNCDDYSDVRLGWGSDNGSYPDDLPLSLGDANGLRRPTVYRQTKGLFTLSMADGMWWVHDLIEP